MDALMVETVGKPVVAGKRPVPTPKEGEIRLRTTVVGCKRLIFANFDLVI